MMLLLVLAGTNSELLSVRKEFYFYLQKWLNSKAHKVNIQTKSLRYPYRLIKKNTIRFRFERNIKRFFMDSK